MFENGDAYFAVTGTMMAVLALMFIAHCAAAYDQGQPANGASAFLRDNYPDAYAAIGGNAQAKVNEAGMGYSIFMALVVLALGVGGGVAMFAYKKSQIFNPFVSL